MVGMCVSSSFGGYLGLSGSLCVGADANGIEFFESGGVSEGATASAFPIGLGPVISNGTVADQKDAFTFVEAGGGWGYSVNGTYAWGTGQQGQQVWTVQISVSVGEGAGYSKGTSNTWVQQPDWGHWQ
jgi:hypothetical protein